MVRGFEGPARGATFPAGEGRRARGTEEGEGAAALSAGEYNVGEPQQ